MGTYLQAVRNFHVEMTKELAIIPDHRDEAELRKKHTMVKDTILSEVCYWSNESLLCL